jgi:hypothetical protein
VQSLQKFFQTLLQHLVLLAAYPYFEEQELLLEVQVQALVQVLVMVKVLELILELG